MGGDNENTPAKSGGSQIQNSTLPAKPVRTALLQELERLASRLTPPERLELVNRLFLSLAESEQDPLRKAESPAPAPSKTVEVPAAVRGVPEERVDIDLVSAKYRELISRNGIAELLRTL